MLNRRQQRLIGILAVVALGMAACESGDDDDEASDSGSESGSDAAEGGATVEEGETIKIAFSAPGADHGWLAAITENAEEEAASFDDVEFVLLEGTNDSAAQVSQVEQLMADDPHVLIILPHEGDPLTPVALEAMERGMAIGAPEADLETPDAPKPRSARRAEAKAQKEAEKRKRAVARLAAQR